MANRAGTPGSPIGTGPDTLHGLRRARRCRGRGPISAAEPQHLALLGPVARQEFVAA